MNWAIGKGLPDASIMIDLCNILKVNVNELLSGEKIIKKEYIDKAEEHLLEMIKQEEIKNKEMLMYENVIGFMSTISFITLIFIASYEVENNYLRIILLVVAFIIFIVGISFALKIETEVGYYECQNCHHKYIPKYSQVYFAMHFGTTRFMKCPKCNKRSWNKKTLHL